MVGRGVDRSAPTLSEQAHDEQVRRLEEVRLSGYKFLRPPGVSKTLKMLHEEQDYEQETGTLSQNSSIDYFSFGNGPNVSFEPENSDNMRAETARDDSEEDFDFTTNMTLPTMNASLPSIYLPPPDTN